MVLKWRVGEHNQGHGEEYSNEYSTDKKQQEQRCKIQVSMSA